jgi:hypothetical protein
MVYPLGYYITRVATTYNNLSPATSLIEKWVSTDNFLDMAAVDVYNLFKAGKFVTTDIFVTASNPSSSKKKNTWNDLKNLSITMSAGANTPKVDKLSDIVAQHDKTID